MRPVGKKPFSESEIGGGAEGGAWRRAGSVRGSGRPEHLLQVSVQNGVRRERPFKLPADPEGAKRLRVALPRETDGLGEGVDVAGRERTRDAVDDAVPVAENFLVLRIEKHGPLGRGVVRRDERRKVGRGRFQRDLAHARHEEVAGAVRLQVARVSMGPINASGGTVGRNLPTGLEPGLVTGPAISKRTPSRSQIRMKLRMVGSFSESMRPT